MRWSDDMDEAVRTTCPYCGVGCGVLALPDGAIKGDPDHPANRGRLCSKGAALGETLAPAGRLLHPEINGRREPWKEALALIADSFARTIEQHGPEAVAFYASGQFLTEDYYVANKLMKGFIGAANIDTNSRLCMASSVAGHVRAFGEDVVPGTYDDLDEADLVVLVGSNAAWCHPVLFQRLAAARQARGTRIVVIDPRRTATAEIADLHLALRPGADVAVFAGLLAFLAASGAIATGWVRRHASGLEAALAAAAEDAPSPEAVAGMADLPVRDIETFYGWFAATERTVTLYSQGVNQSSSGTDKVTAILNCHVATGRIGRPGMGPFSLTGQPNAMGGREVGGLANQLAAHMGFADPAALDRVRRFWNAPNLATQPGLKAVELFDAVRDGRIKALWIMGTNPAATMPRAQRVREALAACPFLVVADCWPTDTTALAQVVLPAAGWGEKDGTVTNSERRISRQRAFRAAPGEAQPDWWMLAQVAQGMGWGDAFAYRAPAEIFREHAALSAFENDGGRAFDIGALAELDDAGYDRMEPVLWPAPRGASRARDGRLFHDGGFATEDGRARLVPIRWRPPAEAPDEQRPLLLNTGRSRDQWHTMTRTGRVPRLMLHASAPLLEMHPEDAQRLGLAEGDLARLESRHGAAVLGVRLAREQRQGELFASVHWTDRFSSAGPIGRLVGAAADPVSGQPELKATPVAVTPLPVLWRGLLLRRDEARLPVDLHWSRVPLATGHAYALAGWQPLPGGAASEAWIAALLGAPDGAELVVYADPRRRVFRYASLVDGCLDACLFLAGAEGALPGRDAVAGLLGSRIEAAGRAALVAGLPAGAAPAPETGRIICACFAVGLRTLHDAIRARRMGSVAEIGAALGAGTNCGSCLPELEEILREAHADAGAAA
ncbi:MAG: molybdopterin-dependent oxidoreductase [Stellaceae bacterium]